MSDLDLIRERVDIVELIGETVDLKPAGRTFKGRCPFHSERTPSFVVSPERRTWHCFGSCATGGDLFSFIMRRDNLDFREALKILAERAGIELSTRDRQEVARGSRLIQANEAAASYFHNALLNSSEAGAAREYAEGRGLDAATIRNFELGYAPDAWDSLGSYLRDQSYSPEDLTEAGLLVEGERGRHDRFRGRLMFPIRDERGRVVGFGGRALGDAMPKYLNSSQSSVFDKGSLLYALDRGKEIIRKEDRAVVVEGYMDAIAAHQHGYQNVVATLGTALTDRHVALLKRYTRRVALALDADAAGLEAMLRGEQLIRELRDDERSEVVVDWSSGGRRGNGRDWTDLVRVQSRAPVDVRVFSVPAGKDPDDAIRADPSAWPSWVEAALPPFEFRLRYELSRLDRTDPRARSQLLDRMVPLLTEIGDRALQTQYLSRLAMTTGVREDDVRLRLNERSPATKRGQPVQLRETAKREPVREPAAVTAGTHGTRTENFCLALLLRFSELRSTGLQLSPDAYTLTVNRLIFALWSNDPDLSEESIPDELREQWTALHAARIVAGVAADPAQALDECLRRMALRRMEGQKRLLTAAIMEQQEQADLLLSSTSSADLIARTGSEHADEAHLAIAEQVLADVEVGRHLHLLEYELRTGHESPTAGEQPQTEPAATAPGDGG